MKQPKACPLCGHDKPSILKSIDAEWMFGRWCMGCGLPLALWRCIQEAQDAAAVLRRELGRGPGRG